MISFDLYWSIQKTVWSTLINVNKSRKMPEHCEMDFRKMISHFLVEYIAYS
jgi:hypothetical protein